MEMINFNLENESIDEEVDVFNTPKERQVIKTPV
jgi:hypothetical protein